MEMKAVRSAYRPSGKLPARALAMMILASLIAVPLGLLMSNVIVGVGGAIAYVPQVIHESVLQSGAFDWYLPQVIWIIVVFLTLALAYGEIGGAGALIVCEAGNRWRNRNTVVPVILSAVSTVIALPLLVLNMNAVAASGWLGEKFSEAMSAAFGMSGWALSAPALGGSVALVTTVCITISEIRKVRFCEACETPLLERDIRSVGEHDIEPLVQSIQAGDFARTETLLDSAYGGSGAATLLWCPRCGRGYVEVKSEGENLVASREIGPEDFRGAKKAPAGGASR